MLLFIYLNGVVVYLPQLFTLCCCLFTLMVLLFIYHSCLPCVVVVYSTVVLMATMLLCWHMVRYVHVQ